ncbi:MAG: response regulator [Bradyrhizobium icense]|jgi:two-component system chemotaxis response regulator CheY|nr:MAG: response regulator [Bradyrhizobium icense]
MRAVTAVTHALRSTGGSSSRLRLLVVDDDPTQARLITRGAEQAGHVVTVARSVAEAVKHVWTRRFDCVTLDLLLGDGDGTEVLSAMSEARFRGAVIVISGMDAQQRIAVRQHGRLHGIELRSLPKPVDLSALRVCLADLTAQAMDLPAAHLWGGIKVRHEHERHRSCTKADHAGTVRPRKS